MSNFFSTTDGYVSDILYPSYLHLAFQVPWIDAACVIKSIAPPRYEKSSFTHVDLGCGDGLGLILAAASHPQGQFVGVDFISEHIERGQKVIDTLGLKNIQLVCANFSELDSFSNNTADYVTAQGVLTWINSKNRESLLNIAFKWLRPGGVFCVGYNAFPGWKDMIPFMALIRATANEKEGSSRQRFDAAWAQLRKTELIEDGAWKSLENIRRQVPHNYFVHEYLNTVSYPRWSGDVISEMGELGLAFVGQTMNHRLRDDLCYKRCWLESLSNFESVPAHEIAADIYCDTGFRQDIYMKMPAFALESDELIEYRLKSWWKLTNISTSNIKMEADVPAGILTFDNKVARTVLELLDNAPLSTRDIVEKSNTAAENSVFEAIDALFIAKLITPIDSPRSDTSAEMCNDWLSESGISMNGKASSYGAIHN